jgi:hypothetical protein
MSIYDVIQGYPQPPGESGQHLGAAFALAGLDMISLSPSIS